MRKREIKGASRREGGAVELEQLHLWLSGRVQGVGYRFQVFTEANRRNLRGWVRNLSDGRVEVLLQGTREDLLAMREWCALRVRRAIVLDVEERWETPGMVLGEFEIR